MFGRRRISHGNAVDAAQRRLALLAEQVRDDAGSADTDPPGPALEPSSGRHARRDPVAPGPIRRWSVTPHHVALLALTVAAVVAIAAWFVLRSVPRPQPVQLSSGREVATPAATDETAGASPGPTPSGDASASPGSSSVLVVDVTGKVRRPGIVELPAGSRVVDALHAAGGARPHTDTSTLNLARLLVDGEQIVVGVDVPAVASTASPPGTPSPVNLNTATLEQLDTLPGVGPVTAQAILDWRSEHGAFSAVDELLEVSGIGDATLADLEAFVYV